MREQKPTNSVKPNNAEDVTMSNQNASDKSKKIRPGFLVGLGNLTNQNYAASSSPLELSVFANIPIKDSTSGKIGFTYITEVDSAQFSYLSADLQGEKDGFIGAIGINLSQLRDTSGASSYYGMSFTGGIGFQASIGYIISESFHCGIKYASMKQTAAISGYPSQVLDFSRISFFVSSN